MNDAEFAELIRHHPELRSFYHRVSASRYKRAHWRMNPVKPMSEAKKRALLAAGEVGFKAFGRKGFDEKGVPIVMSIVGKSMKGRMFKGPQPPRWKLEVEKLKEALKGVAEVAAKKKLEVTA